MFDRKLLVVFFLVSIACDYSKCGDLFASHDETYKIHVDVVRLLKIYRHQGWSCDNYTLNFMKYTDIEDDRNIDEHTDFGKSEKNILHIHTFNDHTTHVFYYKYKKGRKIDRDRLIVIIGIYRNELFCDIVTDVTQRQATDLLQGKGLQEKRRLLRTEVSKKTRDGKVITLKLGRYKGGKIYNGFIKVVKPKKL